MNYTNNKNDQEVPPPPPPPPRLPDSPPADDKITATPEENRRQPWTQEYNVAPPVASGENFRRNENQASPSLITVENEEALSRNLFDKKIHPVLLVGISNSGKTSLLQSLIAYLRNNKKAGLNHCFGENPFPKSYPNQERLYKQADSFYKNDIVSYVNGRAYGNSKLESHFFIPIDVSRRQPGRASPPLKFAFLEGMGDWFSRPDNRDGFVTFRPEFTALLKRFPGPLSLIFLAPCVETIQGRTPFHDSHHCIANALDVYQELRRDPKLDNLLFLATHWDRAFPPQREPEGFAAPSAEQIEQVSEQWQTSWVKFSSMSGPEARSFMPYSAGHYNEDSRTIDPPGEQKPVFDQYNRILWNWLYGNVVAGPDGRRAVLYPDLDDTPPDATRSRLINLLLWEF